MFSRNLVELSLISRYLLGITPSFNFRAPAKGVSCSPRVKRSVSSRVCARKVGSESAKRRGSKETIRETGNSERQRGRYVNVVLFVVRRRAPETLSGSESTGVGRRARGNRQGKKLDGGEDENWEVTRETSTRTPRSPDPGPCG